MKRDEDRKRDDQPTDPSIVPAHKREMFDKGIFADLTPGLGALGKIAHLASFHPLAPVLWVVLAQVALFYMGCAYMEVYLGLIVLGIVGAVCSGFRGNAHVP